MDGLVWLSSRFAMSYGRGCVGRRPGGEVGEGLTRFTRRDVPSMAYQRARLLMTGCTALAAAYLWSADAFAGDDATTPSAAGVAFFESKIRPVLVEKCYACHSAEAEVLQGGLRVDNRAGLLAGGDSGPAVVPGEPEEGLLLGALRYETFEMPPSEPLQEATIADFERWIDMGAPDPRGGDAPAAPKGVDLAEGRQFWCFQPLKRTAPPEVTDADWPRGDVDRFLLARLEERGLAPAVDAQRAAWLRRVTFDLTGLPPAPAEIDAFVADESPDVYERVVDRLLASPHFGERWGRHWLDVARFAESSGGGRSIVFQDAWRYRDYVIRSFNEDKPLDQFIAEQIAGDLLPYATPQEQREGLVATAYLMLGAHNYEEQDKRALEMDVVDEQIDTIGRGLLGMTIACARCHDHKFDPIPTTDYYALAGILRSTHTLIHENVSKWTTRPLPMTEPEVAAAAAAFEAAVAHAKQELAEAKQSPDAGTEAGKKKIAGLKKKAADIKKAGPQGPAAMAVEDSETIADCQVCIRGSVHHRGPVVPRGVLQAATVGAGPVMPANESGRRELANWIVSPDNPLTARVYVNRVWQHLFGVGLVRTADNFGTTGEPPSHPELLDYLAMKFISDGWSTKRLVRELALSRAYRMTTDDGHGAARDPENRLLWRMNRKRLDAESMRDAMLVAAGTLDLAVGGPNIQDDSVLKESSSTNPTEYGYVFADTRRSVYTPAFRNRMHELFEAFDFADQNHAVATRNVTTAAPQALLMLNSPFVMEQAQAAAARALGGDVQSNEERIVLAFRQTLGREPTSGELALAAEAVATGDGASASDARLAVWQRLYQGLFGSLDFRYLE
jgi:hypothetical protein